MSQIHASKKVVAVMVGQLTLGGSERQLYFFLQRCDRRQWEPIVYVSGELGEWEARIRALHVQIVLLQGNPVAKLRQFRRSCRANNVACFFSWSSYTNGYGLVLAGLKIARIGSFRNKHLADLPTRFRWLWAWMSFHGVTTAVCNSRETYDAIEARGHSHLQAIYIPNAVQLIEGVKQHRKTWRDRLGIKPSEALVVGVGRLTSQKNFARFIEAVRLVCQHTPVRAVIAGPDDGCQPYLERCITALNLPPGTIRLIGAVADARELICAADIFMLSSDYEGMPNVVLEAMSLGVPCICTRVNGVAELIDNGVHGFITEHCAASLADKLALLVSDSELRQRIGRRASDRVLASYNTAAIGAQLWGVCES